MKRNVCMVLAACAAVWGAFAQALPEEWIDVPFGVYDAAWEGGAAYDTVSGTFTLVGSGNDMWNTANDGGRFVFQPMFGDCEVTATIRRPVAPNLAHAARAGVMIRSRNDRGALNMLFARMRGESGNLNAARVTAGRRLALQGESESVSRNGFEDEWLPMRLIRKGGTTTAYFNTNGVWEFYHAYPVPMGDAVNAGIFVSRYSASSAQQITNDFMDVSVRQLVAAQTNAVAGFDVTWVTDLPGISNGWTYTYTLTRTDEFGAAEALEQGLGVAAYTDGTAVAGVAYRYAVTAVPEPQEGQDTPPSVLVGTSAATSRATADTNLMPVLPDGLFAAYYAPTGAVLPYAERVESSVTNVETLYPNSIADNFLTVFNASLCVDETDTYTFFAEADDGLRLWVGEELVIDDWYTGSKKSSSMPVRLKAGSVVPFRLEYFQATGSRVCSLEWRRAGDPAVIVPVSAAAFAPVPLPWRHADIGDAALNGNAQFDDVSGSMTLAAGGNDFTGAADAGHFVWREANGDFDIAVRLDSLTGAAGRRAGLAVRTGASAGAPALTVLATPAGSGEYAVTALLRDAADAAPAVTVSGAAVGALPWLRLTRLGDAFAAWCRADTDAEWTLVQEAMLPAIPAAAVRVGPIASSADDVNEAVAVFGTVRQAALLTEVRYPTDDTYVQGDNVIFGSNSELAAKRTMGGMGDNTQREIFMRFNMAARADVRSATLRLYMNIWEAAPVKPEVMVRVFHDLHWSENEVTWDNAPGGLRLPTGFLAGDDPTIVARTIVGPIGQYMEFDVTDAARRAAHTTGDLTFNIVCIQVITGNPVKFASKEDVTVARRPALILRYAAPSGVAAASGPDAGSVMVSWHELAGVGEYAVYRADAAGGPFTRVGQTAAMPFRDTGLVLGQAYFYRVAAFTADGESEQSAAARGVAAAAAGTRLDVSADTYVQGNGSGGQMANNNYGNSGEIVIKYNSGDQYYHREGYLRFDGIASLGHVERAVLRVTPSTSSGSGAGASTPAQIPVQFIRMPSNNWEEGSVTFNNFPPGYPPPAPRLYGRPAKDCVTVPAVPSGTVMEVDVTEMVREAARVNADGKLSIGIIRMDGDGNFNLMLYPREQGNADRRPHLVYTFGRTQQPQVSDAGDYAEVSWPPYPGATSYVLRRAEAEAGPYAVLCETPASSFKDMTAHSGTVYWYTLAAVTASGEVEASLPLPSCLDVQDELFPVADTMIEENGGTTADVNHGAATTVSLKRSPLRENFFKFDVRGLEDVARARFRVNTGATDGNYGPVNLIVRHGDFGDWNEYGVTYNDPPRGYKPPTTSTTAKGSNELARILMEYRDSSQGGRRTIWLEADVTDTVRQAARDGKQFITLFLTGDNTKQHDQGIHYTAMREHATREFRPVLLLSGSRFGAPQGMTLDVREEGPGFTLAWRPVAGAVRYIVTRHGPTDDAPVVVADNVTGTSFTDADPAFWNDRDYTYTVTAVHADGTLSAAATATQTLTRTFTQPVVADTSIRGGTFSNNVYGTLAFIDMKPDSGDYQREALFRIALDAVPAFTDAEFRIRLRTIGSGRNYRVILRELQPDTGWQESGADAATWGNTLGPDVAFTPEPLAGDPSVVGGFTITTESLPGDEVRFDITRFVKAAQARNAPTLILHLFGIEKGGEHIFTVYSRQAPMPEYMPRVVYTVPRNPLSGTLMILR